MKQLFAITMAILVMLTFGACGCSNSNVTPTDTTPQTIIPSVLPTMETNIPDPDVDTQMPIYTDGTDSGFPSSDPSETTNTH